MNTKQTTTTASAQPENVREGWETVSGGINLPSGYTLWTRRNAGDYIWTIRPTSEGTPSPTSGGYFSIETAAKVKGFKFSK